MFSMASDRPQRLYNFFISLSGLPNGSATPIKAISAPSSTEAQMADLLFCGLGLALIALMDAYALALDRV